MSYPQPPSAKDLNPTNYTFTRQADFWATGDVTNIDNVSNSVVGLVAKGETQMNQILTELSSIAPGQLDQSRLMSAQMTMTRWQLASQLLSNFQSGVSTGLKNTVQNIR